MSQWRVYIAPSESATTWQDWREVTQYVDAESIGDISQAIDKDDFSIGLAKNSRQRFAA